MSSRASTTGLTLVELMITLVLLVTLLGLAVPAMQALLHGNGLRTQAHRLMAALNLARSEAVLRNTPVSVCPADLAIAEDPECGGTYAGGWLVFSNPDRDRAIDRGIDEVLQVFPPLPGGYRLTNRDGSRQLTEVISYLPDGSARANRTLLLCAPPGVEVKPLGIVVNIVGRPRLARGWGRCAGA
jgi:type IV fimbrial biogenesis protein FimT